MMREGRADLGLAILRRPTHNIARFFTGAHVLLSLATLDQKGAPQGHNIGPLTGRGLRKVGHRAPFGSTALPSTSGAEGDRHEITLRHHG